MSGLQTDLLVGTIVAGWKCVEMKPGAQCVTTPGTALMLEWSAGNLDFPDTVRLTSNARKMMTYTKYNTIDAAARTNAFYGQGSGPINIDDPGCTGSEQRLIDCPFSPIHNCGHSEDAGVDCTIMSIILINVLGDRNDDHFSIFCYRSL